MALVVLDGIRSIAAGELVMAPISSLWSALDAQFALIDGRVGTPLVFEPFSTALLSLPASPTILLAAFGVVLLDAAIRTALAWIWQSIWRVEAGGLSRSD